MKLACVIMATVALAAAVVAALAAAPPRFIDITTRDVDGIAMYGSPHGLRNFTHKISSIRDGAPANVANFTLTTHTGTHVDAPGHFNQTLLDEGLDVDSLDLETLNCPCLVVDTPRDKNITVEVMRGLNLLRGTERVLLKTLNTDKKLMNQSEFDWSYTAMTADGAQYLVSNTDIKLIGIDYLSIGVADQVVPVHLTLLNAKVIIPVEGLNLDGVAPGAYTVHCFPLRLVGLDGSPASSMSTSDLAVLAAGIWTIWKARNHACWELKVVKPEIVAEWACEVRMARAGGMLHGDTVSMPTHQRPHQMSRPEITHCFVDAAVFDQDNSTSVAAALLDGTGRLFFLALLIFPVLGVSAGNDCRDDSGADGQHRLEALKYKLIAVASILSSGAVGVSIPLVAGRRFPAFTPESNLFVLVKAFAAGVILATGFVHVLPDSFESLGSPCLPEKPWGDFPFPGLVAMLAAIATMMHGHEAGEGEFAPRHLGQAWIARALERVLKHVDEPGGQDHAGSERLHEDKEVTLRREHRKPPPGHQRDRDADRPLERMEATATSL
ncbi:unnamed protein product [Cuscuta campestris]|uniref:Uncharacterized protein n=1 Tax=Cuscuta campestris TaxID=132261 RepID=A0A484NNI5_9ASTE|nr:unnamed protein product [Cuscuta campestris]